MSRSLLTLALLLVAPVPLAGCSEEAPSGEAAPGEAVVEGVTVENLRLVREADGSAAVRGVVVNGSAEERSVQVVIALYDAGNQRIGEVQVPVERVGAGAEQGFSHALDREAAGASLRRLFVF
ncbi:MAG: FxLYD domain-containing protein [Rubricoccaceae bacterium]|nr:FxLYD domain-containing protein [Rubricoccaceae bacterium]